MRERRHFPHQMEWINSKFVRMKTKSIFLLFEQDRLVKELENLKIEPRKRWNKCYDRNSPFNTPRQLLSAEISNKINEHRNAQPEKEPEKYRNVDHLLRNYESVSRILIYRRSQLELPHGDEFSMTWNEPDSSNVVDEVSGETLRRLTLLCRDVICECNIMYNRLFRVRILLWCVPIETEFSHNTNTRNSAQWKFCGTLHDTDIPCTNWWKPVSTVQIWHDLDFMIDTGREVCFNVNESNSFATFATVDTSKSRPGYLQLREFGTGQLVCHGATIHGTDPSMKNILHPNNVPFYLHSFQHGPASKIIYFAPFTNETDQVPFYSCSSWPPIAESWIDRERPCNWPSKETIHDIVSRGCRVVHKPHELSVEKETEFRFSFSEAERILFDKLTCDQRKCFIALKTLIKYCVYKLECKTHKDINLSSYCLKTIFLWTCETIPADHWETTNGWSECLLYMIDRLYAFVKAKHLPGYFIPENNLLDNMEQSGPLLDEIESLRNHPISHAGIFITATKCFRGFHSKICDSTKLICCVVPGKQTEVLC